MGLTERLKPVWTALKKPGSWLLLILGFSAGLPFLLTGSTLGFWMREEGLSLTAIGFLSWVSLLYGLKVVWSPWMDKIRLPWLYRWLGQRRSFMLLSQVAVAVGLITMALIGPKGHLLIFGLAAMFVAFAAASQEIAIDAWRVEQTLTHADEALNPTVFAWGYKFAAIVSGSLILIPAEHIGWPLSFTSLAAVMGIGMIATLLARPSPSEAQAPAKTYSFKTFVAEPLRSFFQQYGMLTWLILLTLALYRLADYLIGPVVGPLYQDTGLSNETIAYMRSSLGLAASFIGVAIGGGCVLWLGTSRSFWLGALVGPLSNLAFALMAAHPGEIVYFGGMLVVDNIANGIADTALIAFMTRLTVKEHSVTHFSLMCSVSALTGKLLKGFAGQVVDSFTPIHGLFGAYQLFFLGTALMGIPAVILCWLLRQKGVLTASDKQAVPENGAS